MTQYSDELYHHGIKGMRWGVRRTPEQLGHRLSKQKRKLTKTHEKAKAASSSRNYKKMEKLSKSAAKTAKAISKTQRKYDEAKEIEAQLKAEQARQLEEKKNNLLKSGTAAEIFANRELFKTNELNEAINRATALTKLKDLNNQDMTVKMNKAKQFIDGAANVGKSIKGAADAYNDLAKVINSLAGEKKLPTFDTKGSEDAFEKLLRTGDADKIAKALPNMTDEQVNRATKRLSKEKVIKSMTTKTDSSDSGKSTTSTPKEEETPEQTTSTETKSAPAQQYKIYNAEEEKASTSPTFYAPRGGAATYDTGYRISMPSSKDAANYDWNKTGYTNTSSMKVAPSKAASSDSYYISGGSAATYDTGKNYIEANTTNYSKTSWTESGKVTGDFYKDGNKYLRDNAETWGKVTIDYKKVN